MPKETPETTKKPASVAASESLSRATAILDRVAAPHLFKTGVRERVRNNMKFTKENDDLKTVVFQDEKKQGTVSLSEEEFKKIYAEGLASLSNDDWFLMSGVDFPELSELITGHDALSVAPRCFNTAYKKELTELRNKLKNSIERGLKALTSKKIPVGFDELDQELKNNILAFLFIPDCDKGCYIKPTANEEAQNLLTNISFPEDVKNCFSTEISASKAAYDNWLTKKRGELLNPSPTATNTTQSASSAAAASASSSSSSKPSTTNTQGSTLPSQKKEEGITEKAPIGSRSTSSLTSAVVAGHDGFFGEGIDENQRTAWLEKTHSTLNGTAAQLWNDIANKTNIQFGKVKNHEENAQHHSATIHLQAKTDGTKAFADITLSRKNEMKDNKPTITWTCDAKFTDASLSEEKKEKMRFQLIAAESLALRQAQNLSDFNQIGIVVLENEKSSRKPSSKFQCGDPKPNLSPREEALIEAHFQAGYTVIHYDNRVFRGLTTAPTLNAITYFNSQASTTLPKPVGLEDLPAKSNNGGDSKSVFLDFNIPFYNDKKTEQQGPEFLTAERQAVAILEAALELKNKGYKKVGITYSANQEQTQKLLQQYSENKYDFSWLDGGAQAAVMQKVAKQMMETERYKNLQGVFQIVPITTMKYTKNFFSTATAAAADDAGSNTNNVQNGNLAVSLENAKHFLQESGTAMLGWKNQDSCNIEDWEKRNRSINDENAKKESTPYAIGGFNALDVQPRDQKNKIMSTLCELSKEYGPKSGAAPSLTAS